MLNYNMVTFDYLFPYLRYLTSPTGNSNLMMGKQFHPCSECGRLTQFIEINFQTHICSPKCLNILNLEYNIDCIESHIKFLDKQLYNIRSHRALMSLTNVFGRYLYSKQALKNIEGQDKMYKVLTSEIFVCKKRSLDWKIKLLEMKYGSSSTQ